MLLFAAQVDYPLPPRPLMLSSSSQKWKSHKDYGKVAIWLNAHQHYRKGIEEVLESFQSASVYHSRSRSRQGSNNNSSNIHGLHTSRKPQLQNSNKFRSVYLQYKELTSNLAAHSEREESQLFPLLLAYYKSSFRPAFERLTSDHHHEGVYSLFHAIEKKFEALSLLSLISLSSLHSKEAVQSVHQHLHRWQQRVLSHFEGEEEACVELILKLPFEALARQGIIYSPRHSDLARVSHADSELVARMKTPAPLSSSSTGMKLAEEQPVFTVNIVDLNNRGNNDNDGIHEGTHGHSSNNGDHASFDGGGSISVRVRLYNGSVLKMKGLSPTMTIAQLYYQIAQLTPAQIMSKTDQALESISFSLSISFPKQLLDMESPSLSTKDITIGAINGTMLHQHNFQCTTSTIPSSAPTSTSTPAPVSTFAFPSPSALRCFLPGPAEVTGTSVLLCSGLVLMLAYAIKVHFEL